MLHTCRETLISRKGLHDQFALPTNQSACAFGKWAVRDTAYWMVATVCHCTIRLALLLQFWSTICVASAIRFLNFIRFRYKLPMYLPEKLRRRHGIGEWLARTHLAAIIGLMFYASTGPLSFEACCGSIVVCSLNCYQLALISSNFTFTAYTRCGVFGACAAQC